MKQNDSIIKYSFVNSLPVMFGYVFLGTAFGIVLNEAGYGLPWALLFSVVIFAGSMQFALVSLISSGASLPLIGLMTLFINSRHIFYGISFVEEFRKMKQRLYMIFSLTDETYSVLTLLKDDPRIHKDNNKPMFLISIMDQSYWVLGSVIGSIAGNVLPFDFTGIDFSMTALFVVILVNNIKSGEKDKSILFAAISGLVFGTVSLLIFGADKFILPALIVTVLTLVIKTETEKEAVSDEH